MHTDWLAIFRNGVISVSEGYPAGEMPGDMARNVEVNIEGVLNVSVDWTFVSDLFEGNFELKMDEINVKT